MRMAWVRCLLFVILMCFAASSMGVEAISTNCSAIKGNFVYICHYILPFAFSPFRIMQKLYCTNIAIATLLIILFVVNYIYPINIH